MGSKLSAEAKEFQSKEWPKYYVVGRDSVPLISHESIAEGPAEGGAKGVTPPSPPGEEGEEDPDEESRRFVLRALEAAGCAELADTFADEEVDAEALMMFDKTDLLELGAAPAAADRVLDFLSNYLMTSA